MQMFFRRRNNDYDTGDSRIIPKADIDDFTPPEILPDSSCTENDLKMIHNLSEELIKSGVLEKKEVDEEIHQDLQDVIGILKEANRTAHSEQDWTPESFDPTVFEEIETNSGDEKVLLPKDWFDEFDESNTSMYDDTSYVQMTDSDDNLDDADTEEDNRIAIMLPDGRIIYKARNPEE